MRLSLPATQFSEDFLRGPALATFRLCQAFLHCGLNLSELCVRFVESFVRKLAPVFILKDEALDVCLRGQAFSAGPLSGLSL